VLGVAALTGLLVALVGIFLTEQTANPVYDSSASVVIGLLLAGVAVYLAKKSKGLLIGEGADKLLPSETSKSLTTALIRKRFPDIKHTLIEAESITALERNAPTCQPWIRFQLCI